jgi:hypothetical protein
MRFQQSCSVETVRGPGIFDPAFAIQGVRFGTGEAMRCDSKPIIHLLDKITKTLLFCLGLEHPRQ